MTLEMVLSLNINTAPSNHHTPALERLYTVCYSCISQKSRYVTPLVSLSEVLNVSFIISLCTPTKNTTQLHFLEAD